MAEKKQPEVKEYNPENPNADLDLSEFDYENLKGESFAKYQALVQSLNGFQNRDFEQYMASGIFKMTLNANMDKEEVLDGIRLNQSKPLNKNRVPVNSIRNLNAQIMDKNNPHTNSRYYLLKK